MINLKFSVAAILLEISSWASLAFLMQRSDASLLSYLSLHGLASVFLAFSIYPLLWGTRSQPRWAVISLIATISFLVPLAGFLAAVLALLAIRVYPLRIHNEEFSSITLPEFDLHQSLHAAGRTTGMRKLLNNPSAPTKNRFTALVSLSNVAGHIASPMLRDVLNDPNDDLRLLAYGMLDRMEQKISQAIHEEMQVWKQEQEIADAHQTRLSTKGLTAARRLSDLYWELVYQGLALEDMHTFAVSESLRYCNLVLQQQPEDGSLLLRKGRLLHAQGKFAEAAECYEQAMAYDLPKSQVRPYQAQLYFEQGQFARAKALISEVKAHNALPKLRPVIDYWS